MVLVQKWPSYQLRFFRQYRPGNCLLRYSRPKKNCLGYKKKDDHFFNFVFLGKIGQANVFYDIVERKNAFLGYKNNKLKKSKNWHFSKGVDPCFWSKDDHFFNFLFLGKIGEANVFYDIVERKNAFLGYKNTKLKKSKNWYFSKWVNQFFLSKNGHFSNFIF